MTKESLCSECGMHLSPICLRCQHEETTENMAPVFDEYTALKKREAELMEALENDCIAHSETIEALEKQNRILREALEKISLYEAYNGDKWPAGIAKEALSQAGGEGND